MHSFESVYERMLFAAGVRTQADLAKILGIKQASISDAKKRRSIPSDWCMRLYDACGVKVDWQRFGTGPVFDFEKVKEIERFYKAEVPDEREDGEFKAFGQLREPSAPFLPLVSENECPVFVTIQMPDGSFPEAGRDVFPAGFVRSEAKVFRLLDPAMTPELNKGALVAVERVEAVDGDIVAVFRGRELCFRRAARVEGGWELRTPSLREERWFISEAEWPMLYYGKAVWAFQPL